MRPLRFLSRAFRAFDERSRQKTAKESVIKAREKRNNGEVIEERKVAADDEEDLKRNEQHARDVSCHSRTKREPWHDQFNEMVPCRLGFQQPTRRKMQIPADRVRDRLCLVMIVETSEIAPARVAAQFDQACADHDAKSDPPKKPDNQDRRPALWKRPTIEQRTKKDGQETGFEQLNFP